MKSFFSKKSILGTMAVAAVCMLGTSNAQAQEFTIQGDLVSSYVCVVFIRGEPLPFSRLWDLA